jgi:hypothetical protein
MHLPSMLPSLIRCSAVSAGMSLATDSVLGSASVGRVSPPSGFVH